MKYRAKQYCFLNKETKTTRVIYTPQVFFDGYWCCFKDAETRSGIVEYPTKEAAAKHARYLYKLHCQNN